MLEETLSPRERVRRALNHEVPDRIPLDLEAEKEVWPMMRQHLSVETNDEVLDRLGIDIRHVEPRYQGRARKGFADGSYLDEFGFHKKVVQHAYGRYIEYAGFPLAEAKTVADVEAWPWAQADDWDVSDLAERIDRMNERQEQSILYESGGVFEFSWGLRGMERFLIDLIKKPELAEAIMRKWADFWIERNRKVLEAADGRIQIAWTYDDVGTQTGPMISPRMFREQIKPHHVRMNQALKEFDVTIMFHSCGSIVDFIDDFIDMGIEVLNPLQPRATGMDLAKIKATYGDRICLHGGVDIQQTLPHGTTEEVAAEVQDLIRVLGVGGGYVLAPSHALQADTPPENIVAMYEAARSVPVPD